MGDTTVDGTEGEKERKLCDTKRKGNINRDIRRKKFESSNLGIRRHTQEPVGKGVKQWQSSCLKELR